MADAPNENELDELAATLALIPNARGSVELGKVLFTKNGWHYGVYAEVVAATGEILRLSTQALQWDDGVLARLPEWPEHPANLFVNKR